MPSVHFEDWEIEAQVKRIVDGIKHLELAKTALQRQLMQVHSFHSDYYPIPYERISTIAYNWVEEGILRFTLEGILPHYDKEDGKYYREMRQFWVGQVLNFVKTNFEKEGEMIYHFDKPFVHLVQYFPDLKIRDLDNRSKKFIFDGLRQGKIISDDNWQHLMYMESGKLDDMNPRTEVWLSSQEQIHRVISLSV